MSEAPPKGSPAANADECQRDDPPRGDAAPRVVSSERLLCGATQLAIHHKQTVYFLRQTRFGKLILTK